MLLLYVLILAVARPIGRLRRRLRRERVVLVTGRFDSPGWANRYLRPLAAARLCHRLYVVTTNPLPKIPGMIAIYPPAWLARLAGATLARLLTCFRAAIRIRPDVVGGFRLLPSGLAANMLARMVWARSLYFCVGGPEELLTDGTWQEAGPLARMETHDQVVQRRLLRGVADSDLIVTTGTRSAAYFRDGGIASPSHVIAGCVDTAGPVPNDGQARFDVIFVGRLTPAGGTDLFLRTLHFVRRSVPSVRAVMVGDGPLRREVEMRAISLGLHDHVHFAGRQDDVTQWLGQALILVLTAASEALPMSLMEAMALGLPTVASDVGDVGDLVHDGVSGYLAPAGRPDELATHIVDLLTDRQKYLAFSCEARRTVTDYSQAAAIRRWNFALADLSAVSGE